MHCRKSLLFDNETASTKKNHSDMFDVTMASFDGAEVCKLIGLFLLNDLSNFLDVSLSLTDGTYYPYRKPNNETLYIDSNSNHPPTIIKHLPAAIGRRISDIPSTKEVFNKAKPHYESALKQSGHDEKLMYTERKKPVTHTAQNSRKNRQRNIIWFNPPYSVNVQTNIGREFLTSSANIFRKNHRYNKIFNKNNIKVSYSCTDNLQTIIRKHNRKILQDTLHGKATVTVGRKTTTLRKTTV